MLPEIDDGQIRVGQIFYCPRHGISGMIVAVVRPLGSGHNRWEWRFLVDYGRFRRWHRLEDWEGRDGGR